MIKRVLEWKEDEMYGDYGWIPDWIPNANIASGFGIAHDVLEHDRHDSGSIEDEFKAMGAMVYVRERAGYFYRGFSVLRPYEQFSRTLYDLLNRVEWENDGYVAKPKRTRVCNEDLTDFLTDVRRDTKRLFIEEFGDDVRILKGAKLEEALDAMIGWMRVGFVKARQRYYHANPCDVEYMFVKLTKEVEKLRGEIGEQLIITVNPKKLTFKVKRNYPDYYDYY